MLKFITSLSFLYIFTITILLAYGLIYYREFSKFRSPRRRFPLVFFLISAGCFFFLWVNFHPPLGLKTFSNLDHHFISHDGFIVKDKIELGKVDSNHGRRTPFNSFVFKEQKDHLLISSAYSEEPFLLSTEKGSQLLSAHYPVLSSVIRFSTNTRSINLGFTEKTGFTLTIGNEKFTAIYNGKRNTNSWNLFKDQPALINSSFYTDEQLTNSLKNIFIVPDQDGQAYYLSGQLYNYITTISINNKVIRSADNSFTIAVPFNSRVGWGNTGNPGNKNQFFLKDYGNDGFILANTSPVSYPLTEENREDWSLHAVNKFLVSASEDMFGLPAIFKEGYKFSVFDDSNLGFEPVWLSYNKSNGKEPIRINGSLVRDEGKKIGIVNDQFLLPARAGTISWLFTIKNTFDWKFSEVSLPARKWQLFVFGSLFFFFLLVFLQALLTPAYRLSWVWQLLSCISIVLLATRFFMYWRYKTFPPYEGLDLPSLQQLYSIWNFLIIIVATLVLAAVFSFDLFRSLLKKAGNIFPAVWKIFPRNFDGFKKNQRWQTVRNFPKRKYLFLGSWFFFLFLSAFIASLRSSDQATARHISIGLIIFYFIAVLFSYKHSPLVVPAEKAWWKIRTGNLLDITIANPVKSLLSLSLLAVFAFIDIGFAIIFLNFILFNEAFLYINYTISGLSGGSRATVRSFIIAGVLYFALFVLNLLFAAPIFNFLLELQQFYYVLGYALLALILTYTISRLLIGYSNKKRSFFYVLCPVFLFGIAFFFFPKEKILEKAEMTKYRVAVMTMPVDKAIQTAYEEGNSYEPVIRAAQNQWFINTFIYKENNPGVNSPGFKLLPHAPQNKGAKYNAQATDLVTSRFFIAEHGNWSVLFYILLLLVPATLLASFYKIYPDFTNRINPDYPPITIGFSVLNYLMITALLVILAATGRYIFFGQDLPFQSILSKQSIFFPTLLIIAIILLFNKIRLEQYPNRKKFIPGGIVFILLTGLLFFAKPQYNKSKDFRVADLSEELDDFIQFRLQPVLDYMDSSSVTKKYSIVRKDRLFTDSVRKMLKDGSLALAGKYFLAQVENYMNTAFTNHLDQRRMIYLDINSGHPKLEVNKNYFRVEPPPHLQQYWTGNVYGDSTIYNLSLWDPVNGTIAAHRLSNYTGEPKGNIADDLSFSFNGTAGENVFEQLWLINKGGELVMKNEDVDITIKTGDSIQLSNPARYVLKRANESHERILVSEPDAFMKNYFVNGSRHYVYPLEEKLIWARHFAEGISSEYVAAENKKKNAFISLDRELTDSLASLVSKFIGTDTAYKKGAEYGISIADGDGRLIAIPDFLKGMERPDPNDKIEFNRVIHGMDGTGSQAQLRKQIGNVNLLRMKPGPGSTLKPIIFAAIAAQLNLDWDAFASEGFLLPRNFYGGEKVAEYDFEKPNGRISTVKDYLRLSDNYYHSNLLLLGSYSRQSIQNILAKKFISNNPGPSPDSNGDHWPYFSYQGKQYWLNGFENWPGYKNGKADFGSDSSFLSIGLQNNFGIATHSQPVNIEKFSSAYDSLLLMNAYKRSGFLLPEYSLFDQQGGNIDHRIPYDLFTFCFRGHVKGSSQVLIPPVKMLDVYGKLITQNKNYCLTLNPYAETLPFSAFDVDNTIAYNSYLSLMRENVFAGMREALFNGTASRLGSFLKEGRPYYYYAKTGTTGDNELKTKSKLLSIIISQKDITDPDFNFRNNRVYIIYFTSQNGPAKQNEEFQAEVIKLVQRSAGFQKYMSKKNTPEPKLVADRR
jgi:hypothetical protein